MREALEELVLDHGGAGDVAPAGTCRYGCGTEITEITLVLAPTPCSAVGRTVLEATCLLCSLPPAAA